MIPPKIKRNWVTEPTKKEMVMVLIAWGVGLILTVIAMTDIFTKSVFQSKNILLLFVLLFSTFVMMKVCGCYMKNNDANFDKDKQ